MAEATTPVVQWSTNQKLLYLQIDADAVEDHRELARLQEMTWEAYVDSLYSAVCLYERMGHLRRRVE